MGVDRREGRPGMEFFKPCAVLRTPAPGHRVLNETLKGQLDLEQRGGRTIAGVCARVAQRVLAVTAAIWHNDRINAAVLRSLTAYDHGSAARMGDISTCPTAWFPESLLSRQAGTVSADEVSS